jgi:D-alanyl-D-alanine carboxypeptidase/D-alanyl-D-alanine-endopeptidase (penicillin-binding protein 4)
MGPLAPPLPHRIERWRLATAAVLATFVAPTKAPSLTAIVVATVLSTLLPMMESARADTLPATVATALREAGIPPAATGIVVQAVDSDRPLLAWNADLPLNPASVMKLVSTYAALHLLGPAWRWHTSLLALRLPRDGSLEGDLFVRGGGDPKLTADALRDALRTLRARGVREIRGDLVLDRSLFEAAELDAGAFDQEPTRPYNVGPDALLTQFKAVRFQFLPDPERGTVTVTADPPLGPIDVVANVRSGSGPCVDWRAQVVLTVQGGPRNARVNFDGMVPASCGERVWYLGLLSHPEFFHALFRSLWTELGGTLSGTLREGRTPPDARLLANIESAPLAEAVRDINKYSNNVMARQLFLGLSAFDPGATGGASAPAPSDQVVLPASTARSAQRVEAWLRTRGIDPSSLVLENGSGLSRSERMTAAGLAHLLLDAWTSNVMPEFVSSLPIAAIDGTLRTRPALRSMAGDAHIKTGSLNDVRAIAGYVQTPQGRRFTVVMIVNHPNAPRVNAAQDALLRWVHDAPATTTPRGSSAARRSTATGAPAHR